MIKSFVKRPNHFATINANSFGMVELMTGWGNGYAIIPAGHPLWSEDSDDLNYEIEFSEEISYGCMAHEMDRSIWPEMPEDIGAKDMVVGFATTASHHNPTEHTKAWVEAKTVELVKAINNY
jgi:hypothetical protein